MQIYIKFLNYTQTNIFFIVGTQFIASEGKYRGNFTYICTKKNAILKNDIR